MAEDTKMANKTQRASKPAAKKADGEAAVLEKIAEMPERYRAISERLHALIRQNAPALQPRLFYGMPAYAKEGKVVCFFRAPWANEKHEYMTFGLTENANLSPKEGAAHQLIESAWYFTGLDDATEAELAEIVRKAAS